MSETRILTARWGKPNSAALDTYRADGGYQALDKALGMEPAAVVDEVKKLEPARPRRRRLRHRPQVVLPPQGHPAPLPDGQRRRVGAGDLQGPLHHRARSPPADRGDRHRLLGQRHPPAYVYIRGEFAKQARILEKALDEARAAGDHRPKLAGQEGLRPRGLRPPRRRRLHLRRGVGAARVARGQEGLPAAQAALPGGGGPLGQAHHHQQRRDPGQPPLDRRARGRGLRRARHRQVGRHAALLRLRPREPPGVYEQPVHYNLKSSSTRTAAGSSAAGR